MNSKYEFIVATTAILTCGGELKKVTGQFHENTVLKVAAALCRGGGPSGTGRRSEIGSHIFIRGGELKKVMGHCCEIPP